MNASRSFLFIEHPFYYCCLTWGFVFLFILEDNLSFGQDAKDSSLYYTVEIVDPPLAISRTQLKEAKTLSDLNRHFPNSWIRDYHTVEIHTVQQGKEQMSKAHNDTLTAKQRYDLNEADAGSTIQVRCHYIPENTLAKNEAKWLDFSFQVRPESPAEFPGGKKALNAYLYQEVIQTFPKDLLGEYQVTAVTFTIGEEGQVLDPQLFWSTENEEVNSRLLEVICNLPRWKPARYYHGERARQTFAFMLGDPRSCAVNLLNLRDQILSKPSKVE